MNQLITMKRLLALLVCLGLIASIWTLWLRSTRPQGGPGVEILVRLETVYESSRRHGIPVGRLLEAYRQAGVTTLGIEAKSLARLEFAGDVAVLPPGPGETLHRVVVLGDQDLVPAGAPARERAERLRTWLAEELVFWAPQAEALPDGSFRVALPAQYPPVRKDRVVHPTEVLKAAATADPLAPPDSQRDLILGLSPLDVELAREHGFNSVAVLPNRPGLTADGARFALRGLGDGSGFSGGWFDGPEALGWPDGSALSAVGERLAELGVPLVAADGQAGLTQVAEAAGWLGIRWQPVWLRTEPERFPEVARERRATLLYLESPFFDGLNNENWLGEVTGAIRALTGALESEGLRPGQTQPLTAFAAPSGALGLMAVGVAAALALSLILLLEPSRLAGWAGAVVLALGLPAAWLAATGGGGSGLTARVLLAFAATLIFPLLGAWLALRRAAAAQPCRWRTRILQAISLTAAAVAVAVAGGVINLGLGADTGFMLHLNASVGTKVTLLLAPAAVAFLYLGMIGLYDDGRSGSERSIARRALSELARLMRERVTVGHVALFGLLGVIGLIYVTRSGNFPIIPVAEVEARLRAFLQQALLVRPRTKEFLIGYPALIVFLYWAAGLRGGAARRWVGLLLAVAVAIGLVSAANSFTHLHVPVTISLRRVANGLLLGVPLGLAAVPAFALLWRVYNWAVNREGRGRHEHS